MTVAAESYEALALAEPEKLWELHDGELRSKAEILTFAHGTSMEKLYRQILAQVDENEFWPLLNHGRTQRIVNWTFVPDVLVVPTVWVRQGMAERPDRLEVYHDPVPFVAEVWSRSTGAYDVETKFPEYQRRGDLEIWRVHPSDRTVTDWRRQPDGTYTESVHRGGTLRLFALPSVVIQLDRLFVV